MKTGKPLLFTFLVLFCTSFAFSQSVTWEVHHGQGAGIWVPGPGDPSVVDILKEATGNVAHGDPGGFQYADIPDANVAGWSPALIDTTDGGLCFRLERSRLDGIFTGLDFTYFQTFIEVSDTTNPFLINYSEVDDGVRAYVYNSKFPDGEFIAANDARLYFTPKTADLTSLLATGTNRIVLVQFDNAITENYLKLTVTYPYYHQVQY